MKKFFRFILIVGVGVGLFFGGKYIWNLLRESKRVAEAKKGWYVEILTEELNVRDLATRNSNSLDKVVKGDIFKVLEFSSDAMGENYYWYKIRLRNGGSGWVGQKIKDIGTPKQLLNSVNDPTDHATPKIIYYDDEYKVVSIDDINYNHLQFWDDTDNYTVTHKVYHEKASPTNPDQYWIKYTITDGSGKSSSKTQKIVFDVKPSEDKVLSFDLYEKD